MFPVWIYKNRVSCISSLLERGNPQKPVQNLESNKLTFSRRKSGKSTLIKTSENPRKLKNPEKWIRGDDPEIFDPPWTANVENLMEKSIFDPFLRVRVTFGHFWTPFEHLQSLLITFDTFYRFYHFLSLFIDFITFYHFLSLFDNFYRFLMKKNMFSRKFAIQRLKFDHFIHIY